MWSETVGLVSCAHKYLTAETFGHKVNANGQSLRKKQTWSLEPFPLEGGQLGTADDEENVALKSHLGRYLAVDAFGNVTCDQEALSAEARFTITICAVQNNQKEPRELISWAFRNVSRGYFLGTLADGSLACAAKMPQSRAELWHVHLLPARGAALFALRSVGRKRYARAVDDQVQVDACAPWGHETLFRFEYREEGRFALLAHDNRFLSSEGACVEAEEAPKDCLFTLEYHQANVAFRDHVGRYLAAAGRASIMRSRSTHVTKDEQFCFEVAPLQVALRALSNNKWVSTKQGVDLAANQNEPEKEEVFQLEFNESEQLFALKTPEGAFWAVGGASLQTAANEKTLFGFEWTDEGALFLRTRDRKWVCARKSGQLHLGGEEARVRFHVKLVNRRALSLRAANASGFVGLKLPGSGKLEANKTHVEPIHVDYWNAESGQLDPNLFTCVLLRLDGRFLTSSDGQLSADAPSAACAQQFVLELRSSTQLALRLFESNSNYVCLSKNGAVVVQQCAPLEATRWEF